MARPVLSANCPSSDKTDDLPFIHARRNMSWNRKSRISKEGVSVEGFDHLVGYYHLSKQQKEVQFHHLLASVLTHLLHSVELQTGVTSFLKGLREVAEQSHAPEPAEPFSTGGSPPSAQ